jgi:hypothetical protein
MEAKNFLDDWTEQLMKSKCLSCLSALNKAAPSNAFRYYYIAISVEPETCPSPSIHLPYLKLLSGFVMHLKTTLPNDMALPYLFDFIFCTLPPSTPYSLTH